MSKDVVTFQRNKANHHQYLLKPACNCRVWGRGAAKNCSCLLNYCFPRFILKKSVCLHATGSPKWSLFYFPAHRTLILCLSLSSTSQKETSLVCCGFPSVSFIFRLFLHVCTLRAIFFLWRCIQSHTTNVIYSLFIILKLKTFSINNILLIILLCMDYFIFKI